MSIVNTILEQMGGRRMMVMTGAKALSDGDRTLILHLPSRFARDGINRVTVTLNSADTYDVSFQRMVKFQQRYGRQFSGVYCDQLRALFESETGLATHL